MIHSLSGLHGYVCAALCQPISKQPRSIQPKSIQPKSIQPKSIDLQRFIEQFMTLCKQLSQREEESLRSFADDIYEQLHSADLNLQLPAIISDNHQVHEVMHELDEWIDGFNLALASHHGYQQLSQHAELREWLNDLNAIQQHCQQVIKNQQFETSPELQKQLNQLNAKSNSKSNKGIHSNKRPAVAAEETISAEQLQDNLQDNLLDLLEIVEFIRTGVYLCHATAFSK